MGKRALGFALLCLVSGTGRAWGDDDATNPRAPAVDQVEARFTIIQQEINRLEGIGDTAGATAMQASLQHFQNELAGTAPSNVAGPELDVVGLYTAYISPGPGQPEVVGTVNVQLQSSDRSVVLALGGYDPINWNLQLDPGAQVQKIVLSNANQTVLNAPPGVPVVIAPSPAGDYGTAKDWTDYPMAADTLFGSTGLPISSYQGLYRINQNGQQFQIGSGNDDWRAQRVLREMNDLYDQATAFKRSQGMAIVAGLQFTGVANSWPSSTAAIGIMSPFGVKQVVSPTKNGLTSVAYDPNGNDYYGLELNGPMVRYNPVTNTFADIPLPTTDDFSTPTALTYDTKHDRVIVATLGVNGSFYSYSPATQQWSMLASLNSTGLGLGGLTYFAPEDCYYGLTLHHANIQYLLKFSASGSLLDEISLSDPIVPADPYGFQFQMAAAGDYVAIMAPPSFDLYQPELAAQPYTYLIDPDTGEVVYSGVFVPEPAAAALSILVIGVLASARNRRRSI